MRKKQRYYTTITLVVTTLIVVLGIWGYNAIIRPIYLNNKNQTKTIVLEPKTKVAFGKYPEQGKIYGIEIEITGNANSNFDLMLSDGAQNLSAASIKGKDIDFTYVNNWTADSCFIQMIPRGKVGGKVTIDVRFLALEE